MHHAFEATAGFLTPLAMGCGIGYARALRAKEILEDIGAYDATIMLGVPLLFEKGMDTYVDKVAVVIVDEEERYRRLNQRYGYTVEQIKERLNAQMPQEEKIRRADFVIDNSGSLAETQKQVKELIKKCKNSVTEHL